MNDTMKKSADMPEGAVRRPWGWYVTTLEQPGYKTKVIGVDPGQRLSLQSHAHRKEMWSVFRGAGNCTVGDRVIPVAADASILIPTGAIHRMENTSQTEELLFAEVQIGDPCDENDIVRYEDDYGRGRT